MNFSPGLYFAANFKKKPQSEPEVEVIWAIFTKILQKVELWKFVLIILSKTFLRGYKTSKRTAETILSKYNCEKKSVFMEFRLWGIFFWILLKIWRVEKLPYLDFFWHEVFRQ